MSKPILNYTTKIDSHKTVGEIQKLLANAGAKSVNIEYDDETNPIAVTFFIMFDMTPVNYRLPAKFEGVLKRIMHNSRVPRVNRNKEQALKISWRIIKDWLEAQLAIIDVDLAMLPEVFLPYTINKKGESVWQKLSENTENFTKLLS